VNHAFERRALAPELLGAFGLAPDGRVFEFPQDLGQPLAASFIVKDTP